MGTLTALAALVLASPLAGPSDESRPDPRHFTVPRQEASWSRLVEVFDPRWTLPAPPRAARETDLVRRAKALAGERWADDGPTSLRSAGDLAAAARPLDEAGRRALLARLRRERPDVWSRHGELLSQLLLDHDLRARDWRGEDDADADGLFMGEAWTIPEDAPAPWDDITGDRDVQQAMALVYADLAALKQAENDYATYPGYAGAEYEAIFPVAGTYLAAAPGEGEAEQVALQIEFRVDLPFPFDDCTCRLRIRNRLDADGHLVTDVASTSRDYHWLAGTDVFVPLATSDGEPVGLLAVRWFGFDVDGVPDGDGARREGLRGGLGRLKRRAEDLVTAREARELGALCCDIPGFTVTGDRRWRR